MNNCRLAALGSLVLSVATSLSCTGSVITEWNGAVLAAIRPQTPAPLLLVRNLAIIHRAAFDAFELSSSSGPGYLFIEELAEENYPENDHLSSLAAAYAAHTAASILFPSSTPLFNRLLEEQAEAYTDEEKALAKITGVSSAHAHLEARKEDRLTATTTYIPREKPGEWRRTPPRFRPPEIPHGRYMKPYAINDVKAFLPPGPPSFDSQAWVDGLRQVKEIGAEKSKMRTDEQSLIARYWSDFSYTITPPGHWNQIASSIARRKGYSTRREAHLLAWLNTTLMDAGIVCWEAKFHYNFWRPITAIYEAGTDGNPATESDKTWNSFLESPPHPEYPSGHSSFSGAAARFMQLYLETDDVPFSTTSDSVPGHVRNFDSFWECAEEISWSRIYGGIHYVFSGDDGLASGRAVAEEIFASGEVKRSLAAEYE